MFAPNTIIENLLQQKKAQAAMTLDALFVADIHAWPFLDISTILHYFKLSHIGIGESIVKKGLFELTRLGLLTARKIMTRSKGRPAWEYRLKSIAEIAKILGVQLHRDEFADSIPNEGFKSAKAYRASKHYTYIKRVGGKPSRKFLGNRLGVGRRTTANYEKETDIVVIPNEGRQELTEYDIKFAPSQRISSRFYIISEYERDMTPEEKDAAYPHVAPEWRQTMTRKVTVPQRLPYTKYIIRRELKLGHRVYKAWQTTNSYF